jgi:hypothetical protein
MRWKDIFDDPDLVGQTEYLAIHEAITMAVMGTENPDPEQKIGRAKQQQIAKMLEEIGGQARRLAEGMSNAQPVICYRRLCDCGKLLMVIERIDQRASGGKSLEFDWKKGCFTASRCLASFPCPDCGKTIKWNDGSWRRVPASEDMVKMSTRKNRAD